jgi:diadenosine tetraphosphate (Ap4A) HIT family hydrolase
VGELVHDYSMPWPDNWGELFTGEACPMCAQGRPEETSQGLRIFAGKFCDGYLAKQGAQRGYVVAIWRGRHIVEPIDLTPEEGAGYWSEVIRIAEALREHFDARKVNYEILGNAVPHLHTHITARYQDGDMNPGAPLPKDRDIEFPAKDLAEDAQTLRRMLR